jgi:hypothetical protein
VGLFSAKKLILVHELSIILLSIRSTRSCNIIFFDLLSNTDFHFAVMEVTSMQ